jgi:uncharacterized protein with ParB-like and HNH nuclease domain
VKNEIRQLVNEALDHYACDMRALAENTTTKDLKEAYSKKALEIQTLRKTMNDCYIVPKNFLTPFLQLVFWAGS